MKLHELVALLQESDQELRILSAEIAFRKIDRQTGQKTDSNFSYPVKIPIQNASFLDSWLHDAQAHVERGEKPD
jgi:hypothetical protein